MNPALVDRIAALPRLDEIPRDELEWIVAHGAVESYAAGTIIAPKGTHLQNLWIILKGHGVVEVDRGAGRRPVADWHAGDVSGKLPYSRMKGTPGDVVAVTDIETFTVSEARFPELISRCPVFTALTVHTMLDRARQFNTSGLQDEKMLSLGRLSAGLAHELNNPASATVRSAKQLQQLLADVDGASRNLGAAGLTPEMSAAIDATRLACMMQADGTVRSAIEQADREDAFAAWLERHHANAAHAIPLAETAVTLEALDALARELPGPTLDAALRWIAAGCATQALARDIEQAATRIHDLVGAVKRFTYMDTVRGLEPVDVTIGLRDTVRVLAAKARGKGAGVTLDLPGDLPRALAVGSELNQVWLNLLDNALDAVAASGRVTISARAEPDRVVVRVVDDGSGIPAEALPHIFDAFFTTKPQGEGSGLGLQITRQLIRQSNGDIVVQSRPGHTEFKVTLAAAPPAP